MLTVDTHCHAGPSWYEPIDVLRFQMDENGVDHSVLIQHRGMYDNGYLLSCGDREPDRFTPVILIDPDDEHPRRTLTELAERGAGGIRFVLGTRITDPEFTGVWERADELGLVVSVLGGPDRFASEEFERILDACSNVPVVLEHLGGTNRVDPPFDRHAEAFSTIRGFADRSNVYVKVPGLGELLTRPAKLDGGYPFDPDSPHWESATSHLGSFVDAFGARRMMWGSDFPPCASREGYGNTLEGLRNHTDFDGDQLEWILGGTAASVWDIPHAGD